MTEEVQEDPTGVRALWDRGNLNGASQKVCFFVHFEPYMDLKSALIIFQKTSSSKIAFCLFIYLISFFIFLIV